MTAALCHECIKDEYLSNELKATGDRVDCSDCGKRRRGITAEELGKRLEPILRANYVPGDDYRVFRDADDDRGEFIQKGEELTNIIQEVMDDMHSCHDDIVAAVIDADDYWPPDGEEAYWDEFTCYVVNNYQVDSDFYYDWYGVQDDLKHGRRFFSPTAQALFDRLFKGIGALKCWEGSDVVPIVYDLPAGTNLFRARVTTSQSLLNSVCADPGEEVGPPPPSQARSGRMNPDGVAVLYAAQDEATCVAEMRPAIGSDVAVICLITTRALRVLDFTRLERALDESSFFDPEFPAKREQHRFLKRLHGLISQPVVPGRESDYLITQTMAEHLSHVHEERFDGIVFKSAQKEEGTNVVLFSHLGPSNADMTEKFGVSYVSKSLRMLRVTQVEITYEPMKYYVGSDGVVSIFDPYEQYD